MCKYNPTPVDTSDIKLSDDLCSLYETMAKNVHEMWAKKRIEQGWKYGKERNDARKEHPCLIPYEELSELEKNYDRNSSIETLKLIIKMGFEIKKVSGEKNDN